MTTSMAKLKKHYAERQVSANTVDPEILVDQKCLQIRG